MLTFFTTAKPFEGHSGIIQRNALQSWKLLHPDVEVILFGDELGAAETCGELGLRHEPHVERHESGLKRLDYMFARAQQIARHHCLCYSNCDIIFFNTLARAVHAAGKRRKKFLLIGQRWDTEITEPVDFADPDWANAVRALARTTGRRQIPDFVDYFAFSRGLYNEVPPLVVGRSSWDWWLVWKALASDATVVDGTDFILAIHQNHGYAYHPRGKQGTNDDAIAQYNLAIAGGPAHLRCTAHSTHKLDRLGRLKPASGWKPYWFPVASAWERVCGNAKRDLIFKVWLPAWHSCLDATRTVRTRLGLRSRAKRQLV